MIPGIGSPMMVAGAGGPFAPVFVDNFNRPNNGSLGGWVVGAANGPMRIYNNAATAFDHDGSGFFSFTGLRTIASIARGSRIYAAASMRGGSERLCLYGIIANGGNEGVYLTVIGTTWSLPGAIMGLGSDLYANSGSTTGTGPNGATLMKRVIWMTPSESIYAGYVNASGDPVPVVGPATLHPTVAAGLPSTCTAAIRGGLNNDPSEYFDDFEFGVHSL